MIRLPLALLISIVSCGSLLADDNWLLTTAQFKTQTVALKSIDAGSLKVTPAGGGADQTVPMDGFLDLSRTLPSIPDSGRFTLHMTGGDHLDGEPVALKADTLVWKSPTLGEIEIPGSRMIAITAPGQSAPSVQQHEDIVTMTNGDAVNGIIAAITADKITLQTPNGNSDVPMTSVSAIQFASTPGGSETRRGFRIRLDDGSSLVASAVALDGENLSLTLAKSDSLKIPLAHITAIEQVNGPVSWLSARPPSEAVYQRLMGSPMSPAYYPDRTWDAPHRTIDFRGRSFAHGIGVHAYSRLTWLLDGQYAAFRTQYAIEADDSLANATVRIKLDDKVAYERKNVRAGTLSPVIVIDLGSARKLTLEVDGTSAYSQDSLDWIEPALMKQKPAQ